MHLVAIPLALAHEALNCDGSHSLLSRHRDPNGTIAPYVGHGIRKNFPHLRLPSLGSLMGSFLCDLRSLRGV
jgi:hypothetical protein